MVICSFDIFNLSFDCL